MTAVEVPVTIVVMAKAPMAGHVKTRLTPPCTPADAATIARAALEDTVVAALAAGCRRPVVAIDRPQLWRDERVDVLAQRGDGLDERIAAVFAELPGSVLLVGMDTPQVAPSTLRSAATRLVDGPEDAVLGRAPDGGFWAVGLRVSDPRPFLGVPMSTARTGAVQRSRLDAHGYTVAELPQVRDVDTWVDACAVARAAPHTAFAAAVSAVHDRLTVRT
ncbi:MAG TPA: DUF2064 domain-containing protein [Acidimicrobiia bacterium]|nr:DUF2064 domain-containing protein [Acidimicrobiia bacterium]